jgi:hypothetical protein
MPEFLFLTSGLANFNPQEGHIIPHNLLRTRLRNARVYIEGGGLTRRPIFTNNAKSAAECEAVGRTQLGKTPTIGLPSAFFLKKKMFRGTLSLTRENHQFKYN